MTDDGQHVALVTGSSRGLGRAMALELAARGHHVAVHYVASAGPAEEVVTAARALGVRAEAFGADVSQPDACAALVKDVAAALGPLDVLVNNAGITRDTLALRMKPQTGRRCSTPTSRPRSTCRRPRCAACSAPSGAASST
jgi:3-oxoacyl-[acyl-carrier protein] reductase